MEETSILNKAGKVIGNLSKPVLSILVAFVFCGIALAIMGFNPLKAFSTLVTGAFGNKNSISETLVKSTTLIFSGLSYAVAYRCGMFNIGAEGQMHIGAFTTIVAGTMLKGLPAYVHLPLALAAGFVGGAVWGSLAGWLKIRFGANEIITTVMLNYVAIYWVSFIVTGPMKEPPGSAPQTAMIEVAAKLPRLLAGTRLHLGFILAILALILYYIFFWHTPRGYEMRVVGSNPFAAAYAGMNVNRSALSSMLISGGLAGLGGAGEILGIQYRLIQGFSSNYGFDGIAVALLGNGNPVGIFFSSILFGGLRSGGNMMQMLMQVPAALNYIIQGLVIIFVVANIFKQVKFQKANRNGG